MVTLKGGIGLGATEAGGGVADLRAASDKKLARLPRQVKTHVLSRICLICVSLSLCRRWLMLSKLVRLVNFYR